MSTVVKVGTLHLMPSSGTPTPGGDPTSASTTPFMIDADSNWTLKAAENLGVYGGGPPFHPGSQLIYNSFDNVQHPTFRLMIRGSSHNNAVALMQQLYQELNTAQYSAPCPLFVQPNGATNGVYQDIWSGDVQPIQDPNTLVGLIGGTSDLFVNVTLKCWPYMSGASLQTLLNAVTYTNTGTGGNNNFQSLGSLNGDFIKSIGQPMRITFAAPSTSGAFVGYIASAKARTYTSHATSITTSSTSGIDVATATFAHPSDDEGTSLRLIGRFATPSTNLEVQAVAKINSVGTIYTSSWINAGTGSPNGAYIDFGYVKLPSNLRRAKAIVITCTIRARSTNGSATSGTLSYTELVQYYTWLKVTTTFTSTGQQLELVGADSSIASYNREIVPPVGWMAVTIGGNITDIVTPYGTFPRAYSGAGLYFAWTFLGSHSTSATFGSVTAQQMPLYLVARGGG